MEEFLSSKWRVMPSLLMKMMEEVGGGEGGGRGGGGGEKDESENYALKMIQRGGGEKLMKAMEGEGGIEWNYNGRMRMKEVVDGEVSLDDTDVRDVPLLTLMYLLYVNQILPFEFPANFVSVVFANTPAMTTRLLRVVFAVNVKRYVRVYEVLRSRKEDDPIELENTLTIIKMLTKVFLIHFYSILFSSIHVVETRSLRC